MAQTNVDFNDPMLNALNAIQKNERVILAVGQKDVEVITTKAKVVDKKVTLPPRWILHNGVHVIGLQHIKANEGFVSIFWR
jgi:hypothetical protein